MSDLRIVTSDRDDELRLIDAEGVRARFLVQPDGAAYVELSHDTAGIEFAHDAGPFDRAAVAAIREWASAAAPQPSPLRESLGAFWMTAVVASALAFSVDTTWRVALASGALLGAVYGYLGKRSR